MANPPDVQDSLGFLLSTVARKSNQLFLVYFAEYDLTPEQWTVLSQVVAEEGLSQQDVAQLTEKDANNVKAIVDVLVRKGLVRRESHPLDRRTLRLFPTDLGHLRARELRAKGSNFEAELCSGLVDLEKDQLEELLRKVNDGLASRGRQNGR